MNYCAKTLEQVGKTIFTSFMVIVTLYFITSSKKWQEPKKQPEEQIRMGSCHPWHLAGPQTGDGAQQLKHLQRDFSCLSTL